MSSATRSSSERGMGARTVSTKAVVLPVPSSLASPPACEVAASTAAEDGASSCQQSVTTLEVNSILRPCRDCGCHDFERVGEILRRLTG